MSFSDGLTIVAILLGPVAAVLISVLISWRLEDRREKREAKRDLFLNLMAHRKALPPTFALVNSLNLIDVVFEDDREVVNGWHVYYDSLQQSPETFDVEKARLNFLDLLSAMAKSLDYRSLTQTDMEKFYSPIAHGDVQALNEEIRQELLRVLNATARLEVVDRVNEDEG